MKFLALLLPCFFLTSAYAYQAEVAIVLSLPDANQSFVSDILKESLELAPGVPDNDLKHFATGGYYFLSKNGAQSAVAVQVLASSESALSNSDVTSGLKVAAEKAAIVINPFGPMSESLCSAMKAHSDVVFLFGIGSGAGRADSKSYPSCASKNILVVAGLNAALNDLALNQTQSDLIRVSGPYADLKAVGLNGQPLKMSSRYFTMSFVAGKLANLLRKNPSLKGAALVDKFLKDETVELPNLVGKVGETRALLNVVY